MYLFLNCITGYFFMLIFPLFFFFLADVTPHFSPLSICVLQKCLRLLDSGSGTFTMPEKSVISTYVCSTLKYLLQTQVHICCFLAWNLLLFECNLM